MACFVILSEQNERPNGLQGVAKKSKEFKAYFKFMDTSPKAQYDKNNLVW